MEHLQTQKSPIKNTKNDRLFLYLISYSLSWLFIPYFLPQGLITFLKPYALLVAKIIPNIVVFANYSPNPDLVLFVFVVQWLSFPFYVIYFLQKAWHLKKGKIGFFRRLCLIIILFAGLYAMVCLPEQSQIGHSSIIKMKAFEELIHNYLWPNFLFAHWLVCTAAFFTFGLIGSLTGSRRLSDVFGQK